MVVFIYLFYGLIFAAPFVVGVAWMYDENLQDAAVVGTLGGTVAAFWVSVIRYNMTYSGDVEPIFVIVMTVIWAFLAALVAIGGAAMGRETNKWSLADLVLSPVVTALGCVVVYLSENDFTDWGFIADKCPDCGTVVKTDDQFCQSCGHKLTHTETCDECDASVSGDADFCPSCGVSL